MKNSSLLGILEFYSGHHTRFYPWGGPMNGQAARLEIARSIITRDRDAIFETGTYRGTTTEWFAGFQLPVVSAEISPRYASFAKRRVGKSKNVVISTGNSVDVLDSIVSNAQKPFVYLDAHWEKYLPLGEEIRTIINRWPQAIIMIDDFHVPDDPSYGYDDYGDGLAIDVPYLDNLNISPSLQMFWPAIQGRFETGARRGCAVLTGDQISADWLRESSLLRPR